MRHPQRKAGALSRAAVFIMRTNACAGSILPGARQVNLNAPEQPRIGERAQRMTPWDLSDSRNRSWHFVF